MNRHERRAQGKSAPKGPPPPPKYDGIDYSQKPILDDNDTRALAQIVVDILHGRKKVILETTQEYGHTVGTFKVVDSKPSTTNTGDTDGTPE